jgi:hypothetical protein
MIWQVVVLSLYFRSWTLLRWIVSQMGMLTYRSLMSSVSSLWLLLIFRLVSSVASDSELVVLYRKSRCRQLVRIVLSLTALRYTTQTAYR